MDVNEEEEADWRADGETLLEEEERSGSGVSVTRSGGGDELLGQDAGDFRWFVGRSDVKSRQSSDNDEIDRSSEEER